MVMVQALAVVKVVATATASWTNNLMRLYDQYPYFIVLGEPNRGRIQVT